MAVDLARAKAHLGIDWDLTAELTALLTGYLAGALRMVETRAQTILAEREVTQRFDGLIDRRGSSMLRLAWAPVVTSEPIEIDYLDGDGETVTLTSEDGEFRIVAGIPCLLLPPLSEAWPSTLADRGSVTVRYTAGYGGDLEDGGAGECPGDLEVAVLQTVAHFYHNREAVSEGSFTELPMGPMAICNTYRHTMI